ncbi:MAG: NAD(P)-binding protein [Povalibacter sp.]
MTAESDRSLGMHRGITRRDFLNGAAFSVGALAAGVHLDASGSRVNPPGLTGLRGHHSGSFEVMHAVRDGTFWKSAGVPQSTGETYDLVVVGAGISGLAAAQFFRQYASGRVLVLDNHDDIGGHAKRNEFTASNGRTLIGYGGSQSLQTPSYFSPVVKQLLADIGIRTAKFHDYYDSGWNERHGLGSAVFFRKEEFGVDRLVKTSDKAANWVPLTPLNDRAKRQLIELIDAPKDYLSGKTRSEKLELLARVTYGAFLTDIVRADAQLVTFFQASTTGYFGVGIDATSCVDARANGNPGFDGMDLGDEVYPTLSPSGRLAFTDPDPYIFHFPDGNASVARALVRALIPNALPGKSMEDLVTAKLSYDELDQSRNAVRVRLNAPVVRVKHVGDVAQAKSVEVTYVENGKLKVVSASNVVLACWHRVIPYLTDELPRVQIDALNDQQKVPLIYTNVLLRNWQSFKQLGVHGFESPGAFWPEASIDFPVSMGSYRFAQDPADPVLLHLSKVVLGGAQGRSEREQVLDGRRLLTTYTFESLEREIRSLLARALSGAGFDPARDIEAITVNRWSHGYAYEYMRPWDPYWPRGPLPIETARKPWGRIAIANSDSGAYAYAHSAIDQAARAVKELLGERAELPLHSTFPGPPLDQLKLKS